MHIKFFLFVIFPLENYYVQGFVILCILQTFNKICFFVIIFFVFIIWLFLYTPILHFLSWSAVFYKVSYFVIFVTLPSFFFLFSTILYHVFIYIVVEASRLFVFIIVVFSLSNVDIVICQVHLFRKHISAVHFLSTVNSNKAHLL